MVAAAMDKLRTRASVFRSQAIRDFSPIVPAGTGRSGGLDHNLFPASEESFSKIRNRDSFGTRPQGARPPIRMCGMPKFPVTRFLARLGCALVALAVAPVLQAQTWSLANL